MAATTDRTTASRRSRDGSAAHQVPRSGPLASRMAKKGRPSAWSPRNSRVTMPGWSSRPSSSPSRRRRVAAALRGPPRGSLRATSRSRRRSRALQTRPIAPSPMGSMRTKRFAGSGDTRAQWEGTGRAYPTRCRASDASVGRDHRAGDCRAWRPLRHLSSVCRARQTHDRFRPTNTTLRRDPAPCVASRLGEWPCD